MNVKSSDPKKRPFRMGSGGHGEHVAALKCNKHVKDGYNMYGTWKGVRVGVKRTNGKVSTIFPDLKQPNKKKGKK